MTTAQLLADMLSRNADMLSMTIADFSEPELLARPVAGANHAAWQIGHLITAESQMVGMLGATMPPLPENYPELFGRGTTSQDLPNLYPYKPELLERFKSARAATIAFLRNLTPADLDKPGPEPLHNMAPTVGHTLFLNIAHVAMHLGQIQVIRRKFNKPILF